MRGFSLVELILAMMIFALVALSLAFGFRSVIQVSERTKGNFEEVAAPALFFERLERDLRNMIPYEGTPFQGKERRMSFLSLSSSGDEMKRIDYFLKGKRLIREEKWVGERAKEDEPKRKILFREVKSLRFEYPYREGEEKSLEFHPYWLEEPYAGLPRAVKVRMELRRRGEIHSYEKLISIPRGKIAVTAGRR